MPGKEIKGRSKRAMYKDGSLKPIPEGNKGLPKLPKEVRNIRRLRSTRNRTYN